MLELEEGTEVSEEEYDILDMDEAYSPLPTHRINLAKQGRTLPSALISSPPQDNLCEKFSEIMEDDDKVAEEDKKVLEEDKELVEEEEWTETDLNEVVEELRHLEERLHLWREVRQNTIERLRDTADYMDNISHRTGVARVVGSGGGVLAGGLTLAGGVMTLLTAGAALPVLVAGAGLGLASGITGGAAAITKKVLASQQMKKVEVAIEVDSAATSQLANEVDSVRNDTKFKKVAGAVISVGGLASSTKGLMDVVRGTTPGQTIIAGLGTVGSILGEDVNKEIAKLVAQGAGRVLSGTVTSVLGGVTMLWDMYQLRSGLRQLVGGPDNQEAATQIREIAGQLEEGLRDFSDRNYTELD